MNEIVKASNIHFRWIRCIHFEKKKTSWKKLFVSLYMRQGFSTCGKCNWFYIRNELTSYSQSKSCTHPNQAVNISKYQIDIFDCWLLLTIECVLWLSPCYSFVPVLVLCIYLSSRFRSPFTARVVLPWLLSPIFCVCVCVCVCAYI